MQSNFLRKESVAFSIRFIVGIATLALMAFVQTCAYAATATMAKPVMKQNVPPGIEVEILQLKRIEGKAIGLTYKVTNKSDKSIRFQVLGAGQHAAEGVALVDFKNGKRYGVGRAGNKCLCTEPAPDSIEKNASAELWAQFGAPPADVDTITVIIGTVPPFYSVPIQK